MDWHKTMHRGLTRNALITLLLVLTTQANAVVVHGQAHGLIAFHAETRGIGNTVFGLDGPQLLGQPFTANFRYDTSLAPALYASYNGTSGGAAYRSTDPALDWLSMSITVNGYTHHVNGNYRFADIRDFHPSDPANHGVHDRFQITVEGSNSATYVDSFRRQFLELVFLLPNDHLSDITFPTSIDWNQIDNSQNGYGFRINEFDFDSATNTLTYERYVSFGLDVQQVSASSVPLPSALLLMLTALPAFSLTLLRRKRPR